MKSFKCISLFLTIFFLFNLVSSSFSQDQERSWTGTLADGQKINQNDLNKILVEHLIWLKTTGKEGERAILAKANLQEANLRDANLENAFLGGVNLQKANLTGANLKEVNLIYANLQEANLWGAHLQEVDLTGANIAKANLTEVNLQKAFMSDTNLQAVNLLGANLQNAILTRTNLQKADLSNADLQEVYLTEANLREADLTEVVLEHATMRESNLQMANLTGANLQNAFMMNANFQEANLTGANLQNTVVRESNFIKVNLSGGNLQEANLTGTNLQEANFRGACLQDVDLTRSYLQDADVTRANLKRCIFEIKPNSLPSVPGIAEALNLSQLKYKKSPHALVELRKVSKESGFRNQEREITYAINRSRFENSLSIQSAKDFKVTDYFRLIGVYLDLVFFGLTCEWGMSPERPLVILVLLFGLFTVPYMVSISIRIKKDGIWRIWIPERVRTDLGSKQPELIRYKGFKAFRTAFYFSLLSAFNIGWRDLDVGGWISKVQPREYRLQATGWVRSVSGIQSLISVYLLALAVLTYFGRPFESY